MTCVCLGAVQEHMWRSKTTCGESVPFFSLWVPGIKVKSSGLYDKWFLLNHLVCLYLLHLVQSRSQLKRKVPLTLGEYLPTSINTAQKLPRSHVQRSVSWGILDPVKSASYETHTSLVFLFITALGRLIPHNCTSLTCSSMLPPLPPCYHLPPVPEHLFIKIPCINGIMQTFFVCLTDFTKHSVFQVCLSRCTWQYLIPLQYTSQFHYPCILNQTSIDPASFLL